MKKLFAIVLALVLCVSALSVVAFAAETITIHAYVPGDWNAPNVYSWPTNGEGDPAWPGTAMTQEDGQWYVGTITMAHDNLIINNGSGSPQTADLNFDGGYPELWVVVGGSDGSNSTIYYEAPDNVDAPVAPVDPVEPAPFTAPDSMAIVGSGIPGVGEWAVDDAAGDMEEVSELVYVKEIGMTAGTSIEFKFAGNDSWDSGLNFGSAAIVLGTAADLVSGNESQNMALTVDKDVVLKFTVDLTALADGSGAATVLVEETDGEVTPVEPGDDVPAGDTVTVHARIPASWGTSPCFWAWNLASQENAFESWPGEVMTQDGEWFTIQIPSWVDSVIVNDGGSTQTADLSVEAGKELWIDVYAFDNVEINYSDPGERVEPTEPETEPTTAPTTAPTETTEATQATEATGNKTDNKAATRTHTILIIVLVLVWVVVVAEVITIFLKKKS